MKLHMKIAMEVMNRDDTSWLQDATYSEWGMTTDVGLARSRRAARTRLQSDNISPSHASKRCGGGGRRRIVRQTDFIYTRVGPLTAQDQLRSMALQQISECQRRNLAGGSRDLGASGASSAELAPSSRELKGDGASGGGCVSSMSTGSCAARAAEMQSSGRGCPPPQVPCSGD